jgi:dynein heavy chain
MDFFTQQAEVLKLAGPDALAIKLHLRLSEALQTYEALWLNEWRSQHAAIATGVEATLLVQHPQSNRLLVNSDQSLKALLEEARVMKRESIVVPTAIANLMQAAQRHKRFTDRLQSVLDRYYLLQQRAPALFQPLMAPAYEQVMRALRPGLVSLTWQASNIDAYVGRIAHALDNLEATVQALLEIVRFHIQDPIGAIRQTALFPDLAALPPLRAGAFFTLLETHVASAKASLLASVAALVTGVKRALARSTASDSESATAALPSTAAPLSDLDSLHVRHYVRTALPSAAVSPASFWAP